MAGNNKRNIYLVGFMGTGKTTIGRELGRSMGRKFQDVDIELERRLAMSVNEIFAAHGEEYFRQKEEELALELAATTNRVIAAGGGTILNPRVFEAFQGSGTLICLYTRREDLVGRLQRTDKRPVLHSETPEEVAQKVERLLEERKDVYGRVRIRIDTTNLTPMTAARKIHELLSMRQRVMDHIEHPSIELS